MPEPRPRPESIRLDNYIDTLASYSGRSSRIEGFRRIAGAIGEISGIETIDPLILNGGLFSEYSAHGLTSPIVQSCTAEIWKQLDGERYPLIVRRLFPDQNGDAKTGPRSGNVQTIDDLTTEIGRFYDYFAAHYNTAEVGPEIMVHRVVDTGNPPLREKSFLPHPGGDVTPLGNHAYEIRGTFGADESVQGFPCDRWVVKFNSDGSLLMSPPVKERKTHSVVPAPGKYRRIEIPADAQTELSLRDIEQVLPLARVARNIEEQYGGHRLEFDGTVVNGKKTLFIIEAVPFEKFNNSYEGLRPFGNRINLPLNLITSSDDIQALPSGQLAIVHLPPEMFQGNELRQNLQDLALTAKAKNIPLVALVAGDIATQHAVRDLIDFGHTVWFTGKEQFLPGEEIRLFTKPDGDYDWERENLIVPQNRMKGRGVEKIGGKAIGQDKLEQYGFRTPRRFDLETSLWRRSIEALELCDDMERLDQLSPTDTTKEIATDTDGIQEKIIDLGGNHIPDLEEALAPFEGVNLFAVRSSAKIEDGKISFAGIYHTELNVPREGLPKAILKVLASAVDPLAVKSALGINIKPSEASIAVIIQEMIQGPAAGTIFTKEHLTGDENTLRIEAIRGIGNQVVEGTAEGEDIQQIWVDKRTGKIKKMVTPRTGPILNDSQITDLTMQGLAIETSLGGPQDIEWTLPADEDPDRRIVFLQTRPL